MNKDLNKEVMRTMKKKKKERETGEGIGPTGGNSSAGSQRLEKPKRGHWGFTPQKQGPVPEAGDKLVLSQCWLETWPVLCLQGRRWTRAKILQASGT